LQKKIVIDSFTHSGMKIKILASLFCVCGIAILASTPSWGQADPLYLDSKAPLEKRVDDLFGRLTLDEKISLLMGGTSCTTCAIPRLNVPVMRMADAGAGVRGIDGTNGGPATQFTCGVMMASTWDPALIGKVGAAIGVEAHNKRLGSQILLGPAVNIQRSPLGGRNGEYFSEDPYLAARMAVGFIQGIQGTGTGACIKHFACNNEEKDRDDVNVQVSERALREIYLPAFEAGVKEGRVWTVMSSYNQVNGFHSSANHYLLTDILKRDWGFNGMVMSDWGGVHEVAGTINAGNDLEMPDAGRRTPENVKSALQKGQTTQAAIDDSVRRILRTIILTGLLDGPPRLDPSQVNSKDHQLLCRELAEKGIVLLKNQNSILPFDAQKIHSIAIIGPGSEQMQGGALGSPHVDPPYSCGPLEGIKNRVGNKIAVNWALCSIESAPIPSSAFFSGANNEKPGLQGEYFSNQNLTGNPVAVRTDATVNFDFLNQQNALKGTGVGPNDFSVRWTGKLVAPVTGHYQLSFAADDGCRLFLDGKKIIDHWTLASLEEQTAQVDLTKGQSYDLRAEYFQAGGDAAAILKWEVPTEAPFIDAANAARTSDVAVVVVTTDRGEAEGKDRSSMALPNHQDDLIKAVATANKNTVVVLNNGTPVDMQYWIDQVPGILEVWFPGQEGGNALAAILFGDVNPSGKLPTTLGVRREDYPDYGHFPGTHSQVDYAEGIYVGYRHFDKENITPFFPFGHGLSYTTFEFGSLQLSDSTLASGGKLSVNVKVTNTGQRAGEEVVQLYLHDMALQADRPVRELKGFSKVALASGESKIVSLEIIPRDLAYFDVAGKQWRADPGDYEIQVGASSRDIRQKATIHLSRSFHDPVPESVDSTTH
jgi:beta-glucosidase